MKFAWPRSWGLSVKFSLSMIIVVSGVAFTIGAVIVTLDWRRFREELADKTLLLAHSVSVTAPEAILRNDTWSLYRSLKGMTNRVPQSMRQSNIITAMILDPEGRILAHLRPRGNPLGQTLVPENDAEALLLKQALATGEPTVLSGGGFGAKGFLEAVVPLRSDEKPLGVTRVRLSTYELYLKAQRSALIVLGLTVGLVLAGSILSAVISRRMVRPLTAMTRGLEAVGRGEFGNVAPIQIQDDDELGKMAASFNAMATELAEKKALEEEIAVSEKLVALGRITAGVAHEVNNPLAGLLNCINTLKKHPDDQELIDRYLPVLEMGLNRIKAIVRGLLVELRVEDATEESGVSCLEDLREAVEAEIGDRPIHLVWENHLDERIQVNRHQVQQVVFNLLKNAVQVVAENGTVTFRSFRDGNCVILEVEDDGPGILPEHRSQLFDPFFTTRPNGTGLGLWIVYRLVESMRGVIEVESKPRVGTLFQVTVPATEVEV